MYYRVFLDTNIYEGAAYSFRNGVFNQMREYAASDELTLVINSVIEGEVRSHIQKEVTEEVRELNKIIKRRLFAGFRKLEEYTQRLEIKKPEEWVNTCLEEFDTLLTDCKVERIGVDGIGVEQIVSDYFHMRPPFEAQKPDEFKDAIAAASLLSDIHEWFIRTEENGLSDEHIYCVVSTDAGFRKAIEAGLSEQERENIRIFRSLNGFIEHMVTLDKQAEFVKAYLTSAVARGMMEETIREAVYLAELSIERDTGDYIEYQEIDQVSGFEYEPFVLGIYEENGIPSVAKAAIEAKCDVAVCYEFLDEENSYWDKEEGAYLWENYVEMKASYGVSFDIVVSLDITGCAIPDGWVKGDAYDFAEKSVEFGEYLDIPKQIELNEWNLLDEELVSPAESEDIL